MFIAHADRTGPDVKDLIISGRLESRAWSRSSPRSAKPLDAPTKRAHHRDVKPKKSLNENPLERAIPADFGLNAR